MPAPHDETRMIEGYTVQTAIHIGGREIVYAENHASSQPYMVCNCSWDNPMNVSVYGDALVSEDYLEIMAEFVDRISTGLARVAEQRTERGISGEPLTAADCIDGSWREHYENQLIVIKPEQMVAYARTPDNQLLLATGGNGCNPDARGTAVFAKNLFTGTSSRWNRYDVAGVIRPDRIPAWAKERLAALGQAAAAKPSIQKQLVEAKKTADRHGEARSRRPAKGKVNQL